MGRPGAVCPPGTLSSPPGVYLDDCTETEQRRCFSEDELFASWAPGACLAIRVFDSSKPSSCLAVDCAGVRPSGCPTFATVGVPSSLVSGSPFVLSLSLAALLHR